MVTRSATHHDYSNRTAVVEVTTTSADPSYDGLRQTVTIHIIERSTIGETSVIATRASSPILDEGASILVGSMRLGSVPDAPIFLDGVVRVYVTEVASFELNALGLDEADVGGNSAMINRTMQPELPSAYPLQLGTNPNGWVAELEFTETNWDTEQSIVVTAEQDNFAEPGTLSTLLAFFVDTPDITHGREAAITPAAFRAAIFAEAAEQNISLIEAVGEHGFDVIVLDDDPADIALSVVGID